VDKPVRMVCGMAGTSTGTKVDLHKVPSSMHRRHRCTNRCRDRTGRTARKDRSSHTRSMGQGRMVWGNVCRMVVPTRYGLRQRPCCGVEYDSDASCGMASCMDLGSMASCMDPGSTGACMDPGSMGACMDPCSRVSGRTLGRRERRCVAWAGEEARRSRWGYGSWVCMGC
jgi:hypothetical protein